MTSTDLSLDLSVLEGLDFPPACGHSMHSEESPWHGGDATHVAVSFHGCPGTPDRPPPFVYPCCAVWAQYVIQATLHRMDVQCNRCGFTAQWEDMVKIISTL